MNLQLLLEIFPSKDFQAESDYKPIFEVLAQLRKKETTERRQVKIKDLEADISQGATCNQLFAYFLLKFALNCGQDESLRVFIQEASIVMCLLRRFLNEKGYQLSQEGNFTHKPNQVVEYCSGKNNSIKVLTTESGLSSFFYEWYPCYLSNVLR